jgi:hypothetical protein
MAADERVRGNGSVHEASPSGEAAASPSPTASLHLVRPKDMLVLDFDFHNLAPDSSGGAPHLRRVDPNAPSHVVVRFESQHVSEETFDEPRSPLPPGQVAGRAVAPSRIAFLVPDTVTTLPYTEDALLAWWQWIIQVVVDPVPPDALRADVLHTDLALVDWLHLTPEVGATWAHATHPVEHGGRTELWHTRLASRGTTGQPVESIGTAQPPDAAVPTVRAVAADPVTDQDTFGALPPAYPGQIVALTSDRTVPERRSVRADLLALSASGATLDLAGHWDASTRPDLGLNLARWDHHAWQGRDDRVLLEQRGFLFPFGHQARMVTETTREFDDTDGSTFLRRRQFIVLSELVKTFPAPNQQWAGRGHPFVTVTLVTTGLPDLPTHPEPLVPGASDAYWIQDVGTGLDVVFTVRAVDVAGRTVRFTTSLGFVPYDSSVLPGSGLLAELVTAYGDYDAATDQRRWWELSGQVVAYASEARPGIASFPTARWFWGVEASVDGVLPPLPPGRRPDPGQRYAAVDSPLFFPRLLAAQARVPSVDAIIGPGDPVFLVHDQHYLDQGFGDDAQVYVRVQRTLAGIRASAHSDPDSASDEPVLRSVASSVSAGAIATPNLAVGALSIPLGVVSGSQESITKVRDTKTVDYKEYFPDLAGGLAKAALLGGIYLGRIVPNGTVDRPGDLVSGAIRIEKKDEYPPKPGSTTQPKEQDTTKNPIGMTVSMEWSTPLVTDGAFLALGQDKQPQTDPTGDTVTKLTLLATNTINYLGPQPPSGPPPYPPPTPGPTDTATVKGTISDFWFSLPTADLNYVVLKFTKLEFSYTAGGKPKFDPDIDGVTFGGPFEFINALRRFLGNAFGSSGSSTKQVAPHAAAPGLAAPKSKPTLDLATDHVGIGVSLGIPGVAIGVFSLTGLTFQAGVTLPFDGSPVRARFGFGSPDNKFQVTVDGLGGGGHFVIELSSRPRMEVLEASVELGANVAVDLAVASGRLTVMAGIFFRLEKIDQADGSTDDKITLIGYITATGRLSVLGLISVSAEFHVDLTYVKQNGQATITGHAVLSVSIDIFFFSETVSVQFEKTFVGGDSPSAAPRLAAAGTSGGNNFGDLVSRADWRAYCAAFAS